MKFILTADFHCGKPGRLRDCLWALRVIREYAKVHSINQILVLGDFFHDRVNVNIEVGSAAISFLQEAKSDKYNQEWFVFPGNHDMFLKNSWDSNSLKFLGDNVTLIEKPGLTTIRDKYGALTRFWIIPFIHYENVYMKVLKAIEDKFKDGDILLTHIGTTDAISNVCFLCKHWSLVNFAESKFKRVFSGHFHTYQQVGENMWFVGSPIPFNHDEGLVDHGFLVYDSETAQHEFINIREAGKLIDETPAADFMTITDDDAETADVRNAYVRLHLNKPYTDDEFDKLKQSLADKGAISVTRMRLKEIEIEVDDAIDTVDLKNDFALLQLWFDNDQPTDINLELLEELNKSIVEESKKRTMEDESDEG